MMSKRMTQQVETEHTKQENNHNSQNYDLRDSTDLGINKSMRTSETLSNLTTHVNNPSVLLPPDQIRVQMPKKLFYDFTK